MWECVRGCGICVCVWGGGGEGHSQGQSHSLFCQQMLQTLPFSEAGETKDKNIEYYHFNHIIN